MGRYKVCEGCHIAFDKRLKVCPSCGREIMGENVQKVWNEEGEGRKYYAGGESCNYCDHCYGSANWCPYMDD